MKLNLNSGLDALCHRVVQMRDVYSIFLQYYLNYNVNFSKHYVDPKRIKKEFV